ncbi:ribose 5-phosphate isomerase B [Bacteriovorax stolpii]|uniref:Ribose 5-phosphate isomerase B n=1 Tax=Bacteriovorax stolpii TaxID=960 RepID=A0A2K9NVW4_BACTC|nr:ribose 5-phosphate isomerase B [Bacteriovorax stolpii]AUN99647.1 ribose 5-phosphate isomerase B [Bacteriovorax stolpii]QDK40357.1 ribose 5-phosphate isomerase B [Bacteriovorax stolpii]TDP51278.1 ribose-5-phosphate isomerase [Bacteriovorax stolpii]
MKIAIGSDHAAYEMKEMVKHFLQSKQFDVIDCGTYSSERADYPEYAKKVSHEVISQGIQGILLCGSGIGVSIVANRFKGVRAALCRTPMDAEMARKHNDANVLCLGARFTTEEETKKIIEAWFANSFEGGRHSDRLKLFEDLGESC